MMAQKGKKCQNNFEAGRRYLRFEAFFMYAIKSMLS
jgi:hypothetical protein